MNVIHTHFIHKIEFNESSPSPSNLHSDRKLPILGVNLFEKVFIFRTCISVCAFDELCLIHQTVKCVICSTSVVLWISLIILFTFVLYVKQMVHIFRNFKEDLIQYEYHQISNMTFFYKFSSNYRMSEQCMSIFFRVRADTYTRRTPILKWHMKFEKINRKKLEFL